MSTPTSQYQLPPRPNLDHLKYQARSLRKVFQQGNADAAERFRRHVPRFRDAQADEVRATGPTHGDAQLVIAREYGFANWRSLKSHVDAVTGFASPTSYTIDDLIQYFDAIVGRDVDAVGDCLERQPTLVHARILNEYAQLRGLSLHEALRQQPLPLPDLEYSTMALHLKSAENMGDSLEICRLLLDHGADVNALGYEESRGRCPPIVLATWEGGLETMRLLLEHRADMSGETGRMLLQFGSAPRSRPRPTGRSISERDGLSTGPGYST